MTSISNFKNDFDMLLRGQVRMASTFVPGATKDSYMDDKVKTG